MSLGTSLNESLFLLVGGALWYVLPWMCYVRDGQERGGMLKNPWENPAWLTPCLVHQFVDNVPFDWL